MVSDFLCFFSNSQYIVDEIGSLSSNLDSFKWRQYLVH